MKKVLILLLVCLMLLPLAAACSKQNTTPAQTSGVTDTEEVTEPDTSEDPYTPARDLTKLDFDDQEVRLLQFKYKADEFKPRGGTGDVVEQALWKRNTLVEDDLKIVFKYQEVDCAEGHITAFATAIRGAALADDDATRYHIVAQPSYYVTGIMQEGLYENLAGVDNSYIDLSKKYWTSAYVDASVVNDRYYFVTGELCSSILDKMEVVYVNNALAKAYFEDENILDLVYDKEWTYAKMLELAAKAGEGESTGKWGMAIPRDSYSIDGMLCAMGLTMVSLNDSGVPTANINTQKNIDIVEKLRDLYWNNKSVNANGNDSNSLPIFSEGNAIFTMTLMDRASSLYNSGVNYTLIPMPLYDETQADYIVVAQDNYSIMSLCTGLKNKDRYTAVLEDLCYRSHTTTYPAVYTKTYSLRYAKLPENSAMFDYLFEHLNFDLGYIYSFILGNCKNVPRYLLYPSSYLGINYQSGIGSEFKKLSDAMDEKMTSFIEFFWK